MLDQELELEQIEGRVERVIFRNEENGYAVLRLELDNGEQATLVGTVPLAAAAEDIIAWGRWNHSSKHGEQFEAVHMERMLPTDTEGIYEYLASHNIKGVGPAIAAAIVAKFGSDSLRVMRDEPEKIAAIKGIGPVRAAEISEIIRRQTGMRILMQYLESAGVGPVYALRMYRVYGEDALEVMQDNPYIISSPQIGAGFAEADRFALSQGVDAASPLRVQAGIIYMLRHNSGNGHCFLPVDKTRQSVQRLISVSDTAVDEGVSQLMEDGEIYIEPVSNVTACYLADYYAAEVFIAARLRSMAKYKYETGKFNPDLMIEKIEAEQGLTLAPMQRKTVQAAMENQLVLITGGPGTGKTTSVRAVLSLYDMLGIEVMLAAPTGQAAKRLSQVTGREASTIHRLLEASFSVETDSVTFRKKENDRLKCGALILDECSMIDVPLMRAVLAALGPACRLVMVGDADQLPSVGPGRVFRDIILSRIADTVRLTDIFRQREGSAIVTAAHDINAGRVPNLARNKDGFYFMRRHNPEEAARTVVSLCSERLPKNMGITPDQIQVLTPTKKGSAGTYNLNKLLQQALNPPQTEKAEFTYGDKIFRVGDRIMQIRNNYDMIWKTDDLQTGTGVFNGDVGFICEIDPAAELMTIDFDGRKADYFFQQAAELEHAWATTVHKAQGSEYKAVIFTCTGVSRQLVYRGLLYTAVSRASELMIVVGDENIVQDMVEQSKQAKRYSGLLFRLKEKDEA